MGVFGAGALFVGRYGGAAVGWAYIMRVGYLAKGASRLRPTNARHFAIRVVSYGASQHRKRAASGINNLWVSVVLVPFHTAANRLEFFDSEFVNDLRKFGHVVSSVMRWPQYET
jgi:hypothetical protein